MATDERDQGGTLSVAGPVVELAAAAAGYAGAAVRRFDSVCFWGGPVVAKPLAAVPIDDAIVRRHWVVDPARGLLFAGQDHLGPPGPWPTQAAGEGLRFAIDWPERDIVPLGGRVIVLGGSWDRNYYHWLLNWLPRLGLVRLLAPRLLDDPAVRIMVDRDCDRAPFRDFLTYLGIAPRRIVWADAAAVYRVEQAVAVSFERDYAGEVLAAMAADIRRGAPCIAEPLPRRIWIDRQGDVASLRRVANNDAILPVLAAHGFVPIRLETLPLATQIALFGSAEAVAGVNGAGLANMIFCPPGARILAVERLYARRLRADRMFATLAAVCGLDCEVLHARSVRDPSVEAPTCWHRHNQDVRIDPGALDRALWRTVAGRLEEHREA